MNIRIEIQVPTLKGGTRSQKPVVANKIKPRHKRVGIRNEPINTLPVLGFEADLTPDDGDL